MRAGEETHRVEYLCNGSYLGSHELFPPDSYQRVSDAPEPEINNSTVYGVIIKTQQLDHNMAVAACLFTASVSND